MSLKKYQRLIGILVALSALAGCTWPQLTESSLQPLCDSPAHLSGTHSSRALLGAGYKAIEAGAVDCAERLLLQAQILDPQDPYIWLNLGVVYHKSLRLSQARASYERAMQLDKIQPDAFKETAVLSLDGNRSARLSAGEIAQRNLALMR